MRTVSQQQWLDALASPQTTIEIPVRGFSHVRPDWGWDYRDSPRHIVWFLSGGECRGVVERTPVSLRAGDLLWFSPHAAHEFHAFPDRERARIHHVNLVVRSRGSDLRLAPDFVKLDDMWELAADMAALVDEETAPRDWHSLRMRSLLVLIFSTVFARQNAVARDRQTFDRRQRDRLLACVDRTIDARPTAADLAAELDLSPDYFTRVFRRTFGAPPRTWLVRERMRRAAVALLEYPLPVRAVGRMFGFDNQFLFSRQFTKMMGVSPRAYRARMGHGAAAPPADR